MANVWTNKARELRNMAERRKLAIATQVKR
jgi:hypothetical protein